MDEEEKEEKAEEEEEEERSGKKRIIGNKEKNKENKKKKMKFKRTNQNELPVTKVVEKRLEVNGRSVDEKRAARIARAHPGNVLFVLCKEVNIMKCK